MPILSNTNLKKVILSLGDRGIVMHIPDGFIPLVQCVIYYIIVAPFVYYSFRWAEKNLEERKIPFLGILGAGIFAIQAMNIPIPWGTSGHMVGAAMASILLGSPWAGVLLLSLVLVIQGLVFGDGGLTTLGVNILNMGVLASFIGFYSFTGLNKLLKKKVRSQKTTIATAAFVGAFLSLFIPALICAVELWWAGTFPLVEGLAFMGLYHLVLGLVAEGMITSVAIIAILNYRSDLVVPFKKIRRSPTKGVA